MRAFLQHGRWLKIYHQQPVAFRDSCIFLQPDQEAGRGGVGEKHWSGMPSPTVHGSSIGLLEVSHMQGDKATEGEQGGPRQVCEQVHNLTSVSTLEYVDEKVTKCMYQGSEGSSSRPNPADGRRLAIG